MSSASPVRRRRALARALIFLIVAGFAGLLCFLPFAGRFLVREDPLAPADAIVVLAGSRAERWLEAVDLYHARVAPTIVLTPGRMDGAEQRLHARGIRFPREGELARDAMIQMGVPAGSVHVLPGSVDNTAHEAAALRHAFPGSRWRRIVVVTSKYHTRRAGFAFRREFAGTETEIRVRASRHDESEPARWWRHRPDVRFVTSELQKLVLYRLGLGE